MKTFGVILAYLRTPNSRRNLGVLVRLLLIFAALVAIFSVLFHLLMAREGRAFSWLSGVYWTIVVMSTLGFGDITFHTDLGRFFSIVVLLSGTVFMLVLLPFTFIQFFYLPWMEAQAAARAPRELPKNTRGHVVLTGLGSIEQALIRKLKQAGVPHVIIESDLTEALRIYDQGFQVMVGELDDPDTYRRVRVEQAALVSTARSDQTNTNIAYTVRESCESVPVVATASFSASVDILELAGCNRVLQLGEMLGQSFARRVLARDAKSHVIGEFDSLLIAEAAAAGTPMVGRTLRDLRLRDHAGVNVVGVWERGHFEIAGPDTLVHASSVLVLGGSREQLDGYDELFCIYKTSDAPVVIIGGGRVGRSAGAALWREGIDYRIVERLPERIRNREKYVHGDAAELETLHQAGILESSSVIITTHDDDMNVYLTIYCRRLRPDIQILSRANLERNINTLHRAGADFVLSYASTGANVIFNLLRRIDTLLLAEGLNVFRLPLPTTMVGQTLADCQIRQTTGCTVIAIADGDGLHVNPDASRPLPASADLILIGDAESEKRFLKRYRVS